MSCSAQATNNLLCVCGGRRSGRILGRSIDLARERSLESRELQVLNGDLKSNQQR